ncbi:integrase core domain-containing protein [Bremerella cremea]|uniref:integrase core domain-containing protein n=1 Tax=Bremerella cremea TaxID=1031537 RepID=UPI003CC7FAD4
MRGAQDQTIMAWRQTYNRRRPHSSLGGQTPADFTSQWPTSVQATPSLQQATAICFTQPELS